MKVQTETKQTNKNKIDWEKAYEYMQQLGPKIGEDLAQKIDFLNNIECNIYLEMYPPRISVMFTPKIGGLLFYTHEKELKRNQEKISLIIEEIAKKHNLEGMAGIVINDSGIIGKRKISRRTYFRELGYYTLKPKYNKFVLDG